MNNLNQLCKQIAIYMGCFADDKGYWGFPSTPQHGRWHEDRFADMLPYYSDMNLLLKVISAIEIESKELFGDYRDVIINGCSCFIETPDYATGKMLTGKNYIIEATDKGISVVGDSKEDAMFKAVSFYVGWRQSVDLEKPRGTLTKDAFLEWFFSDKDDLLGFAKRLRKELNENKNQTIELSIESLLRTQVAYVPAHILENSNMFDEDVELDPKEITLID